MLHNQGKSYPVNNRIYIVEDSIIIALHLRKVLECRGYSIVGTSSTAEQAWEEIVTLKPDLILLDIMLEGNMDGVDLATKVKAEFAIPFIYITSLSNRETIQRVKITEPYGYITKPIDENEVSNVIEMTLYKAEIERERKQAETTLKNTFNNTSIMVWSVDRDFKINMANDAFKNYLKNTYAIEVHLNEQLLPKEVEDAAFLTLKNIWEERYRHALGGNAFKVSDHCGNRYFDFSITPIQVDDQVVGLTVYAEDATNRMMQDRGMRDVIRQLSEVRISAIRSALNPHFIFNSLNSIQYFIAQEDRKNAMQYLSVFSKLVRSILGQLETDSVSLQEELEMVKNYIALEELRFENKFDFILKLEIASSLNEIRIPSLIIQPFIENAIQHGLCNRKGKGELRLTIQQQAEKLTIDITDNGIGRQAAQSLKKKKQSKQTKAGDDHLKRIQCFGDISIADLTDSSGDPVGTQVLIQLDLNNIEQPTDSGQELRYS